MDNCYELLTAYTLNDENYRKWREEHTKIFGELFSSAFEENAEAQIHLTAALINICMRNFTEAIPKLTLLESIAVSDYDRSVVNYFLGLNYEMLEDEEKMNEYYQKLTSFDIPFAFPISMHPYYRTAKFAQRASECTKSIFYYQKALSLYDGTIPNEKTKAGASQIIYDIATVYLYMHEYDKCEKFLGLSKEYDSRENQHRTYVTAILYAVQGKQKECQKLLNKMSAFLKRNCKPMTDNILAGKDMHYCSVPQDREHYSDFWHSITLNKHELEKELLSGDAEKVQALISDQLSSTLAFMKRRLDCLVEIQDSLITVYCKNYFVKTLMTEYEFLFLQKPEALENWKFISANHFENH